MGNLIYRLLDKAYNRTTDFLSDVGDVCFGIATDIGAVIFAIVIYGTLPIWIVPYKIVKTNKERQVNDEDLHSRKDNG